MFNVDNAELLFMAIVEIETTQKKYFYYLQTINRRLDCKSAGYVMPFSTWNNYATSSRYLIALVFARCAANFISVFFPSSDSITTKI